MRVGKTEGLTVPERSRGEPGPYKRTVIFRGALSSPRAYATAMVPSALRATPVRAAVSCSYPGR